jgi:glycosyltransferase involved in cell wall biosynthesis
VKILLINKFYYLAGGTERYVLEWEALLRSRGHEVMVFSMRHPENFPSRQERFFTERVRFDANQPLGARLRAAQHSLWSFDAAERLRELLKAEGTPDVAHLHSFMYQLTPAVLEPLVARGVPIVQTCHDYQHICVNQHLYNHRVNRLCEECLRRGRLAPLWTRCMQGSFARSAAGSAAGGAEALFGRSRCRIRRFLTPSGFMRRKMIEGGLPARRLFHEPHFIRPDWIEPSRSPGEYILFVGRLVPEKGIGAFLDAAALAPDVPCKVAGTGPLEPAVRARAGERTPSRVELLGQLQDRQLSETIRGARAVVVPSEWYEPFSLVILEAMAAARPVIASRLAGPAEIISHGADGLLVPAGSAEDLAAAFRALWRDPSRAVEMGRCGLEKTRARYGPEGHYQRLMKHFGEALP